MSDVEEDNLNHWGSEEKTKGRGGGDPDAGGGEGPELGVRLSRRR